MQEYLKKILGSGHDRALSSVSHIHPSSATLIISNNEMEDIIKLVKSFDDSGLLLKGVTETVQNEVKEQKGEFLSMLLGTLGASLLGNILTGPGVNRVGKGRGINRAGEGVIRAGYGTRFSEKKERKIFNAASPFN